MSWRALLLVGGLVACAFTLTVRPSAADGTTSARSYGIPNHGKLELVVPTDWREIVRQSSHGGPPTITFSPGSGDTFKVLVTPGWGERQEPDFNSQQAIRVLLEGRGRRLLSQAKETTLVLKELRGQEASGYYYSLTDRAPNPGEYEYMAQGAVGVGDLLVLFTILYHYPDSPERQATLEMLKTARQKTNK